MLVDLHIYYLFYVNKVLTITAKSIDSGQPAQSAQADLGRNFFTFSQYFAHQRTTTS